MILLVAAFAASFVLTLLAVRSGARHAHLSHDHDLSSPQKFHVVPVPRIGGIGIIVGVLLAGVIAWWFEPTVGTSAVVLVVCGVPAFAFGLREDLTKSVSPRRRLVATAVSAGLAVYALDAVIIHTAIPGLDWIVATPLGAAALTVFVVAGVANAVNIIDGFNGLASMCGAIILIGIAYVAFQVGDATVGLMALAGAGAALGFFFWNFPAGLIFLGDGGAYFLGYYMAELAILLLHRNPQVSPMFPLLICIYPVFETLFSIYRKKFLRGMSPGMPDGLHFHMLVYKRLVRWAVGQRGGNELIRRNSMTAPYLWILCMTSVVPAVLWWDSTAALATCIVLFGFAYVALYWRIVRFKAPRWLVSRR